MAFAIMRCEKLKSFGSFGGAVQHCFRERDTPNADETRTAHNEHFYAQNETQSFKKLREILPDKVRKNGVIAIEYMFTASSEFFDTATTEQKKEFFAKSIDWLKQKYGEQNIVVATVHNDEKTPHLSAFVVPIDSRGKLNARGFIGSRELLSHDQDTFYASVAHLGLERGIKGSKAKHQTLQKYYSNLKQGLGEFKIEAQDVKAQKIGLLHVEADQAIANRLNKKIAPVLAKAYEYDNAKTMNQYLNKQLQQKQSAIDDLSKDLSDYEHGLSKEQQNELKRLAENMRKENSVKRSQIAQISKRSFKL